MIRKSRREGHFSHKWQLFYFFETRKSVSVQQSVFLCNTFYHVMVFPSSKEGLFSHMHVPNLSPVFCYRDVPPSHRMKREVSAMARLCRLCNPLLLRPVAMFLARVALQQTLWLMGVGSLMHRYSSIDMRHARTYTHTCSCIFGVQEYGKLNIPPSDTCTSSAKIVVLRPLCFQLNQLESVVNLQEPALRAFKGGVRSYFAEGSH